MTNKKNRGFTLVEVLIAVFLSTIVLTAVYSVWLRVTRQMSKSNARQTLQQQLRNAANFMKKDFAAIQEGTFKAPAGKQSADGTKAYLEFKRFKKTEKGKIAQDSVENISYTLENGLLTRKTDTKTNILSTGVDSIRLTKGPAVALKADDPLKPARESMLNIEIIGKRHILGSHELMYHAERTSVVMQDEYYKKTNPSYKSNFDIAKMNVADVIKKAPNKGVLVEGGTLAPETLKALNKDQLQGLLKSQNDLMKQSKDSLEQMNKDMKGVETGNNGWDTLAFWSDSEGEKVEKMKEDLIDADKKEDVEKSEKALEAYTDQKESEFLNKSIGGYSSKSQAEKDLYQKAYEMKVQDRTLNGAYEKMKEHDSSAKKPELMIERATKIEGATWTDEDGVEQHSSSEALEQRQTEAKKLQEAYNNINLAWMGDFGKEEEEVTAYNAAKTLVNQGKAKLDIIDLRDRSDKNIKTITEVMASK